jgi:replicative DNA helicase
MQSEIPDGVCGSDEPRLRVNEREVRTSGYSEAMADQLSGLLDRIDEQVKEARAIAATAAEGDPTALDELTGPIEEMAVAIAALRATTGVSRVAADSG